MFGSCGDWCICDSHGSLSIWQDEEVTPTQEAVRGQGLFVLSRKLFVDSDRPRLDSLALRTYSF